MVEVPGTVPNMSPLPHEEKKGGDISGKVPLTRSPTFWETRTRIRPQAPQSEMLHLNVKEVVVKKHQHRIFISSNVSSSDRPDRFQAAGCCENGEHNYWGVPCIFYMRNKQDRRGL